MKVLRNVFGFYIDASIHVALAVCALLWITGWELDIGVSWQLLGFVFFGTIAGYNFIKFAAVAGMHHRSLTNELKAIQFFSFVCLGLAGYILFQLPVKVWYVAIAFGLLTVFYAVPFLPAFRLSSWDRLPKKNLRTLSGLKIFVVGLVWAGVTVLMPWASDGTLFDLDLGLTFAQRFLLVIVWTLPFEIRDLPYDSGALRTLPQQLGVKRVKGLGLSLLVMVMLLESLKQSFSSGYFLSLVVVFFGSAALLVISKKEQSRYFASFWVESIPIVWMLLFFLLKCYFDIS